MSIRLKLIYTKIALKVYRITKHMLPKSSHKLKSHIEKVSLNNMNMIYDKIKKL